MSDLGAHNDIVKAGLSVVPCISSPSPAPGDIDRLGYLRARIEEHEARIAQDVAAEKLLTEKLLKHYADAPADAILTAEGAHYILQLGMCAEEQQQLDIAAKAKVLRILGREPFLAVAKVTFEVLKASLTPRQYASVVSKERTGRRTLKVVAKVPAAA